MDVNPIDRAVIGQGLVASAREMGVKLIRSAYSTILREASDGSAALLDRRGNVVAQAELIPMQLGPLGATFRPCADAVPPDALEEGDFYINNSPFEGGQHLPDVFIFSPVFFEGTLVGFSASVAHHLDLGGGAPGMNPDATDVHQEGLIVPPSRYNMGRDWNGGPFERLIAANIRVPELTIGDFNAQFAANAVGGERVKQLCARYGADTVMSVMDSHLAYSERRMRAAIAAIPDGVYRGEDAVDDDGVNSVPLPVRAAVTVAGDEVSVDFAGTADQVLLNLNCPFASTVSAALAAVKAVASSPDIPFNQGMARPVSVTAPYGSLLNPRPPAPVRARMIPAFRAFDAVVKALAQAVPDKVIATGFDTTHSICMSRLADGGYSIYLEIFAGATARGRPPTAATASTARCRTAATSPSSRWSGSTTSSASPNTRCGPIRAGAESSGAGTACAAGSRSSPTTSRWPTTRTATVSRRTAPSAASRATWRGRGSSGGTGTRSRWPPRPASSSAAGTS